jgi:hypothetical protein
MSRLAAGTVLVTAALLTAGSFATAANATPAQPSINLVTTSTAPDAPERTLFRPSFSSSSALVTNEYAYWNSNHRDAVKSSDWEMTSGSLFTDNGVGSTGKIDAGDVDAKSRKRTDSAVFRLNTKAHAFGDVRVGFDLNVQDLTSTSETPAMDWDGVHIWLRYQSEYSLYAASVARRDGHVVIKKKCAGGSTNGGTYFSLSSEVKGYPITMSKWSSVSATVDNNDDGGVTINLYENGVLAATTVDNGQGCAPITKPGAVGIRGDNARFQFKNFAVTAI